VLDTGCRTIYSLSLLAVEYLPSWFPGAADRRLAHYCRKLTRRILDEPFKIAKEKVICNSDLSVGRPSSIVAKFLSENEDISPAREEFMKGVAISAFIGESVRDQICQ